MTRKDYRLIAAAFYATREKIAKSETLDTVERSFCNVALDELAQEIGIVCKRENALFDMHKFLFASGAKC